MGTAVLGGRGGYRCGEGGATAGARVADMTAVRLHLGGDGARDLRVEQVEVPEPGPGQLRIRVGAAGVCLSDVHLADATLSPLLLDGDAVTLGHEVAGTVDALGPGVDGPQVGTRVLLQGGYLDATGRLHTRGVDYDGGWAEHALARVETVLPIPDDLPFTQACVVPDAVSTPYAALTTTARVGPATAVGIWGLGGLGTHAVQLARIAGAAPVIGVDPQREPRERAARLGADAVLDPASGDLERTVDELTGGRGLDVALDLAGVDDVRAQAAGLLGEGGRLVLVGLAGDAVRIPDDTAFAYRGQSVLGHYGSGPTDVPALLRLIALGRLDLSGSVTAELGLHEAPDAVRRLADREGTPVRLVLTPPAERR